MTTETDVLYDKYRPTKFDEVFGQDAAVHMLEKIAGRRSSQAFLLSGPSGVGKTTLARITAEALGCVNGNIIEVPAAVYTGVEEMRGVRDAIQYRPFGESRARAVILDECHRLSGNAWDSLLKDIEEPPPEVYWFLCTTEVGKVKETIKTRCTPIRLKPMAKDVLDELVKGICHAEGIRVADDIRQLIVRHAEGSARQALTNLETCRDAKNRAEAASLLDSVEAGEVTLQLCRLLAQGGASWTADVKPLLEKLDEQNPEGVRIMVCHYMRACLRKVKSDREAAFFHNILAAFANDYGQADGGPMLYNSIGQCVLNS